jgi:hypothetical protein
LNGAPPSNCPAVVFADGFDYFYKR